VRIVFDNIIQINPQNTSSLVVLIGIAIWVALWIVSLVDLKTSHRSSVLKFFWMLILTIPLVGVLLYSLSEIVFADWRAALSWRKNDATKRPG
jgi:hypothetical protein